MHACMYVETCKTAIKGTTTVVAKDGSTKYRLNQWTLEHYVVLLSNLEGRHDSEDNNEKLTFIRWEMWPLAVHAQSHH